MSMMMAIIPSQRLKHKKRHPNHKNLIICYSFIIHNDDSDNDNDRDGAGDDDGIYIKFLGSMIKTPTKLIGANQRAICLLGSFLVSKVSRVVHHRIEHHTQQETARQIALHLFLSIPHCDLFKLIYYPTLKNQ